MKLYKFQADWCTNCKVLSAMMDKIGHPHELVNVDVDNNYELVNNFRVRGLPTLVLVSDEGIELERSSGAMPSSEFTDLYVTPYEQ